MNAEGLSSNSLEHLRDSAIAAHAAREYGDECVRAKLAYLRADGTALEVIDVQSATADAEPAVSPDLLVGGADPSSPR